MIQFFSPTVFDADRAVIFDLVREAGETNRFILKEHCSALEAEVRRRTGAGHAVAVSSGTTAVLVALAAAGVGPGDEVVVQAYCCQPVASQVIALGARPIFVDVDPRTLVMDPATVERRISERTKAILPAHLFSCMVDMPEIRRIADARGLTVVEDACVQQGAELDGVPAGRWGNVGTYSFFQAKVMGACGEGGMIVTDDAEIARQCRMLRNHGQDGVNRFLHHRIGFNARMDEIVAGFLCHRYARLDEILARRAAIASYYTQRLAHLADRLVLPPAGREGRCYYIYAVQTPERDRLQAFLNARGIASHVYYPRILPDQRAFQDYADPVDVLPVSRRAARENLALPVHPDLTDDEVRRVADAVEAFFAQA
jgi:dTDP-4-amino-4,6-dideoxygalactose transaminase